MNINRLIFTIEDCLNTLSRFSVASSFVEYCDLRTVIGLDRQDRERRPWLNSPYIAATKRGEYLSVFEVSGAFREMDEASDQTGPGSLESLITSMSDSLNTAYKNSGHKISFVFERDPDMGKEEIEDMVAPQKRSLANTGIQLQDVVDEKVTTLSHGWSGSVAGWRSGVDPTLSATAIAPPMMSLSEDWLNGYRKHALPSPLAVDLICTENPPRSFS